MKRCPKCDIVFPESEHYCNICSSRLIKSYKEYSDTPSGKPDSSFGEDMPPIPKTKREFLALPVNKRLYKSCRFAAIICYICAVISLLTMVVLRGNWLALIDVALLLVLGIGLHAFKSFSCAVLLLAYGIITIIINMLVFGMIGGWLVLIAGAAAVYSAFKVRRAWKQFSSDPEEWMDRNIVMPRSSEQNAPHTANENGWTCPRCGKSNSHYVGSCGCGEKKP